MHPAAAQEVEVVLRGGVGIHVEVHGRGDEGGGFHREVGGEQHVVGDAVRHLAERGGRGGGDDENVGPQTEIDVAVPTAVAAVEKFAHHSALRKGGEGEGGDELFAGGRDDHLHFGALAHEQADESAGFVGGDAAGDAEHDVAAGEGRGGDAGHGAKGVRERGRAWGLASGEGKPEGEINKEWGAPQGAAADERAVRCAPAAGRKCNTPALELESPDGRRGVWGKWRRNGGRGAVGQRVWHGFRPSGYGFRLCARSLSPRQRWAFAASPRCCARCRSACGRRVEPSRWKREAKSAPFFVKNRGLFVESGSLLPRRQGLRAERRGSDAQGAASWSARAPFIARRRGYR